MVICIEMKINEHILNSLFNFTAYHFSYYNASKAGMYLITGGLSIWQLCFSLVLNNLCYNTWHLRCKTVYGTLGGTRYVQQTVANVLWTDCHIWLFSPIMYFWKIIYRGNLNVSCDWHSWIFNWSNNYFQDLTASDQRWSCRVGIMPLNCFFFNSIWLFLFKNLKKYIKCSL